ncbi:MAG: transglutaminase [Methylibium sp.]|nr:transglutaminase [Methylibium sp.]
MIDIPELPAVAPVGAERTRTLNTTALLDVGHPSIAALVQARGWRQLPERERIAAAYVFVRDEVAFGYNKSDDLKASEVLADGYGQCNTKSTLLMALLRALGIPCRFHGFTIDKRLQRGAITGLAYRLAPRNIIHSWVEVWTGARWARLEGFILDMAYLAALQRRFATHQGAFCGYGAATPDLQCPQVDWDGGDTFIQKDGINQDFGLFDSPDEFYARHGVNVKGFKRWLFQHIIRQQMNGNVARIRQSFAASTASRSDAAAARVGQNQPDSA